MGWAGMGWDRMVAVGVRLDSTQLGSKVQLYIVTTANLPLRPYTYVVAPTRTDGWVTGDGWLDGRTERGKETRRQRVGYRWHTVLVPCLSLPGPAAVASHHH